MLVQMRKVLGRKNSNRGKAIYTRVLRITSTLEGS
jgi:hypothetical protein